MRFRVPLPLKVLLSYLLVLGALAVPEYWWAYHSMPEFLESEDKARITQWVNTVVQTRTKAFDAPQIRVLASASDARVVLLEKGGLVGVDSQDLLKPGAKNLMKHPDVVRAMESPKNQQVYTAMQPSVAQAVTSLNFAGRVLYIEMPRAESESLLSTTQTHFRNALAVALSIALLLTLLSVTKLSRPLARLRKHALEMAAGDLNPSMPRDRGDEIADSHVALHTLSRQLRKRLASAGTGDALLAQLVEALPSPIVVFSLNDKLDPQNAGEEGLLDRVIAVNGEARDVFSIEGPTARSRMQQLLAEPSFCLRLLAAEEDGVPKQVQLTFGNDDVLCSAFVLKRPTVPPLYVLLGQSRPDTHMILPSPSDVTVLSAKAFFGDAAGQSGQVQIPRRWPEVSVADAGGQLKAALSIAVEALTHEQRIVELMIDVKKTLVGFHFDAALDEKVVDRMRPLVEPVGGRIDEKDGEVRLWFPRA